MQSEWRVACVRIPRFPIGAVWRAVRRGDAGTDAVGAQLLLPLQLPPFFGRFAGIESVYGWELYDQVLRCVTESVRTDLETSPLRSRFLSLQFTGCGTATSPRPARSVGSGTR